MRMIKFCAQGANSLIGGFSSGDLKRVDDALAKHLVKEAGVAKYYEAPAKPSQPAAEAKQTKPGKKKPGPLAEEIAALEAQIKVTTDSDKAAELQSLLDDKRAELAKR